MFLLKMTCYFSFSQNILFFLALQFLTYNTSPEIPFMTNAVLCVNEKKSELSITQNNSSQLAKRILQ